MRKEWLFGVFGVVVLTAILVGGPPDKPKKTQARANQDIVEAAALTETAHQLVSAKLKDPASAIFNYDLPRRSGLFCGTVRARNSFGGYGNDIYYMLFPFGVIDSEQESQARFKRIWDSYCVDRGSAANSAVGPNRFNDVVLQASGADRAWMLGKIVDSACSGRTAYFMGSGHTGISRDVAFWSLRCSNGSTYEVGLYPDQSPRVLECKVLEQLHAGKCFRRIT
jgi:hypothetical protein